MNDVLEHVFGDVVWVEGELTELKRSAAGHVYFRLVDCADDGSDDGLPDLRPDSSRTTGPRAMLAVTLFDSNRRSVNRFLRSEGDPIRMTDGLRVRVGGRLAVYPERSTVQLLMDRIDPTFTLGLLGQERTRLLAALSSEGVLRANAEVPIPVVPMHIGLITSLGSAAHADVLHELESSGIGFRVSTFDARTQGAEAPGSVVAAMAAATTLGVDVILLVRGGGAASDLAAFDHEAIARSIASCHLGVWTGIGHESDRSVADEVAHTAFKTPTAAAAALVGAVRDAERQIGAGWDAVRSGVLDHLDRSTRRLGRAGQEAGLRAIHRLDRSADAVDHRAASLAATSQRHLVAVRAELDDVTARMLPATTRLLERATSRLDVIEATSRASDPAAALRRGWSITRHADGRLVRSTTELSMGEELTTTIAGGTIRSSVSATGTMSTTPDGRRSDDER